MATTPQLMEALEELATAAERRENWSGDPIRLLDCKAELATAARKARNLIDNERVSIAAAPDLLVALENIHAWLIAPSLDSGSINWFREMARSAIDKANQL